MAGIKGSRTCISNGCSGTRRLRAKRCEACLERQRDRKRTLWMARKADGLCVRCGVVLDEDSDTVACPAHAEQGRAAARKHQRKMRLGKHTRAGYLETKRTRDRAMRAARRAEGGCWFCPEVAVDGTSRCEAHRREQAERDRLWRLAKNAGRRLGSKWDRLLADVERLAPTYREEGVRTWDLIRLVEDDVGPIGPSPAARERRMYRAVADLLREGRLVKVDIGCGDLRKARGISVGYRRPEPRPRRVRQAVTVTAATTRERQVRAAPALRIHLVASQTATVVGGDTLAA